MNEERPGASGGRDSILLEDSHYSIRRRRSCAEKGHDPIADQQIESVQFDVEIGDTKRN